MITVFLFYILSGEKKYERIGWTVSKVDSDVAMYIVLGSFKLTDT
jgi:hypothetical protein